MAATDRTTGGTEERQTLMSAPNPPFAKVATLAREAGGVRGEREGGKGAAGV